MFFGPEQFGVNPPSVWKPDPWGQFFSISAFVGLTALAYLVGGRFGVRAASGWARVVGFVVGIGNGVAMLWYTSHQILHGYSLVVVSGNAGLTDSWLAPVLGLGLVVAFVGLLVAGGKGGGRALRRQRELELGAIRAATPRTVERWKDGLLIWDVGWSGATKTASPADVGWYQ